MCCEGFVRRVWMWGHECWHVDMQVCACICTQGHGSRTWLASKNSIRNRGPCCSCACSWAVTPATGPQLMKGVCMAASISCLSLLVRNYRGKTSRGSTTCATTARLTSNSPSPQTGTAVFNLQCAGCGNRAAAHAAAVGRRLSAACLYIGRINGIPI